MVAIKKEIKEIHKRKIGGVTIEDEVEYKGKVYVVTTKIVEKGAIIVGTLI